MRWRNEHENKNTRTRAHEGAQNGGARATAAVERALSARPRPALPETKCRRSKLRLVARAAMR